MMRLNFGALSVPLALLAAPAMAQDQVPTPPAPVAVAPPPAVTGTIAPRAYDLPDPASLIRPILEFTTTPEIEADFDKFFYFHRDETPFVEAYSDIRECDALASGSSIYLGGDSFTQGYTNNYLIPQYGMAGAAGSVIGSAIADAIFGSAARRQQRRINLRNCMGFKGYQRYGMAEKQWKDFNFEEGHGRKKEGERDDALELQALVASGPKPTAKELGL